MSNMYLNGYRSITMPGCNRTGPRGQGPMTGRGMGYCRPAIQNEQTENTVEATGTPGTGVPQPANLPGQVEYGRGRGGIPCGCGRGFGGGRRGGRR